MVLWSTGIFTYVYLHTYKYNKKYSNRESSVPKPCVSIDKQEIRGLCSEMLYSSERDSSCNGQAALFTVLSGSLTQSSNSLRSGEEAY